MPERMQHLTSRASRDPVAGVLEAIEAVQEGLPGGLPRGAYRQALAIELGLRGIGFERDVEVPIHYKGIRLAAHYRVDLLCRGSILVLVGAGPTEQSQPPSWLPACLAASGATRALVVGFDEAEARIIEIARAVPARLVAEGPT